MKKYAFFGGSFNPPSMAHKNCAEAIAKELNLDKVFFVPVGNQYKKDGLIEEKHRFEMLKLLCSDNKKLDVSDIELNKNINYKAIDVFKIIKNIYSDDEIYFIMGADNFQNIPYWQNSKDLIKKYKYVIVNRNNINLQDIINSNSLLKENQKNFYLLKNFSPININSTELRTYIKSNKIDLLNSKIDNKVLKYIQDNNLYTNISVENGTF